VRRSRPSTTLKEPKAVPGSALAADVVAATAFVVEVKAILSTARGTRTMLVAQRGFRNAQLRQ